MTDAGEGPPVLLLHGFPDRAGLWAPQIDALAAAGHRVVAPDLRGFGDSDRPRSVADYRLDRLLGDLTGLLDALGLDRVDVVGHDWGAVLAWQLALRHPQRVRRLAAVSVGHPAARRGAGQLARSWYIAAFAVPGLAERLLPLRHWTPYRRWAWSGAAPGEEPAADRQIADLARPGALPAALNWYRANLDPRAGRRPVFATGRVSCPTLGVWSTRDRALTERQMTGSGQFVDGGWRYARIRDVDHWVPVHAAGRLSRLLVDFLG